MIEALKHLGNEIMTAYYESAPPWMSSAMVVKEAPDSEDEEWVVAMSMPNYLHLDGSVRSWAVIGAEQVIDTLSYRWHKWGFYFSLQEKEIIADSLEAENYGDMTDELCDKVCQLALYGEIRHRV